MEALLYWLTLHWARLRGQPAPYRAQLAGDIPETPEADVLYLIGEGEHQWFACFLCPCPCSQLIQLNTLPRGRPRWSVKRHRNGTATLSPSIRRTAGCKSHFFMRHGFVEWANDRLDELKEK